MNTTVLDFDDLATGNDPLDALLKLHDRDAGFKVTLFAIPTRCGDALLKSYEPNRDWIQLGVHGWRHARHECLGWTSEETADKMIEARKIYAGFAPIFKAPNWEICDEVYRGLSDSDFAVADHIRNIGILPANQLVYTYNKRLRNDTFNRLHGHIQPWAGTGLTENADDSGINPLYLLARGTQYGFATEATERHTGMGNGR